VTVTLPPSISRHSFQRMTPQAPWLRPPAASASCQRRPGPAPWNWPAVIWCNCCRNGKWQTCPYTPTFHWDARRAWRRMAARAFADFLATTLRGDA
jgi:hypothetical protein